MDNFLPVARTKQKPPFQLERGFFEMQRSDDYTSWMMAISAASHRRRVLHILRFAPQGQSLLIPPLLLSPEKPLRWVFPGAPFISAGSISRASPRRGKAYSFRRSSFPQKNRSAGFSRGPRSFPRAPYPALRPTGAKLTHFAAPPLPRKTASLGFPGGPVYFRGLHILRFAPQGQSLLIPPLLLSPEKPLRWVFPGAPLFPAAAT